MNRITFVLDSLQTAGANAVTLGMVRQLATTGDLTPLMTMFGGGGRGAPGFRAPPPFNARPGEQMAAAGRGGAPGRAGGGVGRVGAPGAPGAAGAPAGRAGAAGGGGAADMSTFMSMIEAFRIPGRGTPGGFAALSFLGNLGFSTNFGGVGGTAGAVPPGDYVVSLTVGSRKMRQKVRVERGPAAWSLVAPM